MKTIINNIENINNEESNKSNNNKNNFKLKSFAKRSTALLLTGILALSVCACGKEEETTSNAGGGNTTKTSSNKSVSKKEQPSSQKLDPDLAHSYKSPGKNIYFNYAGDVQVIDKGMATVFCRARENSIVFCRSVDDKSLPLDKITDELMVDFKYGADTKFEMGDVKKFVVEKSEEVEFNGTKALRLDGYVVTGSRQGKIVNCFMRGYTFEKDGAVCELIGAATQESQTQEAKDEVVRRIDKMMNTLRSEE
ncbi:MAG: hypothetical protein RSA99_00315 [Oscillospiraceae bacterium]